MQTLLCNKKQICDQTDIEKNIEHSTLSKFLASQGLEITKVEKRKSSKKMWLKAQLNKNTKTTGK